jgi:hypothetical protein
MRGTTSNRRDASNSKDVINGRYISSRRDTSKSKEILFPFYLTNELGV